jgi:4-hydroxy-tetrahydrodipicolinate reductase
MSSESDLVLGVIGCTGRLGSAIGRECRKQDIAVGLEASSRAWNLKSTPDVVIDASSPGAFGKTLGFCRDTGAALVYAVSSVPPEAYSDLVALSRHVHVVLADNLSVGHWLQVSLIRAIAQLTSNFPKQPRMSVLERHPMTKRDRPSASARSLARAWTERTKIESHGEIVSQRAGQPVSDHSIMFDLDGASLSISHSVNDLTAAACGAILAARHAKTSEPSLSTMFDLYSNISVCPIPEERQLTADAS